MKQRVVITGLGIISCLGNDLETFARNLREGRSGVKYIPKMEELGFRCTVGGTPEGVDELAQVAFDEEDLIDMDSTNRYGCLAAVLAWENAGLPSLGRKDIDWDSGAVIGSETAGIHTVSEKLYPIVNSGKVKRLGSRYVEQTMVSGVASRIGYFLGLGNLVVSLNATSSTGLACVLDGYRYIQSGRAKRMLCGGAESSSHYAWAGLDSMRVLSTIKEPEKASRPMSASACGFVPSAGGGVVVLESLESALERGARIYAEVLGTDANCGAQRDGGSMTAPSAHAIQRCIKKTLEDANVTCRDIDLINGHLTSTFADPYEVRNWVAVFKEAGVRLPWIHSTKSLTGHPIIAAGGVEMVACCLMLRDGFVHPSLNCEDVHPEVEEAGAAESIPHGTIEVPGLKTIFKSSFGFGDVNACAILRRWNDADK